MRPMTGCPPVTRLLYHRPRLALLCQLKTTSTQASFRFPRRKTIEGGRNPIMLFRFHLWNGQVATDLAVTTRFGAPMRGFQLAGIPMQTARHTPIGLGDLILFIPLVWFLTLVLVSFLPFSIRLLIASIPISCIFSFLFHSGTSHLI